MGYPTKPDDDVPPGQQPPAPGKPPSRDNPAGNSKGNGQQKPATPTSPTDRRARILAHFRGKSEAEIIAEYQKLRGTRREKKLSGL